MDWTRDSRAADIARLHAEANHPILGFGLLVGGLLWVPASLAAFELTPMALAPYLLIALGVYILIKTKFSSVIVPAVLVTLGVGLQLVLLGILTPRELLLLWPMALITFGVVVIFSTLIDDWLDLSIYYR